MSRSLSAPPVSSKAVGLGREGSCPRLLPPGPPLCCTDKEGPLQLAFRAGQAWEGAHAQEGQAPPSSRPAGPGGSRLEHGAAARCPGEGAAGQGPRSGKGGQGAVCLGGRGCAHPRPPLKCPSVAQEVVQSPVSPNQGYGGYGGTCSTYNFRRTDARCQDR